MKILLKCNRNYITFQRFYQTRNILKLKNRDMYQDLFPENVVNTIIDLLNSRPHTVYAGFDPTANSLHVGNLLVLMNLLHWQRGGHNVIALIGGATAKIGDPSGRSTERIALAKQHIDENVAGLHKNITTIFENHQKYFWEDTDQLKPLKIENNESWYSVMNPIELLARIGRHLRMGTLLSRTSVKTRIESPAGMSFTEFSYQLFQAYDWLHLFKEYDCTFQIGGSDQMGNLMSGHELISKVCGKPVYGITLPLVTTEMGNKFGKSAGNAIWLDPDKTTPFTFYQFWMRQPDTEVTKFLKLFSFEPVGKIHDIMRQHLENPERRLPHTTLAEQVTLLVHGEEGLRQAKQATEILYKGSVDSLRTMKPEDIQQLFVGAEIVEVLPEAGQTVLDLALKVGCFLTKHDAVRIISAGGFSINQQKVKNPSEVINSNVHRLENNVSLLRVGKKNYYIIKWYS